MDMPTTGLIKYISGKRNRKGGDVLEDRLNTNTHMFRDRSTSGESVISNTTTLDTGQFCLVRQFLR